MSLQGGDGLPLAQNFLVVLDATPIVCEYVLQKKKIFFIFIFISIFSSFIFFFDSFFQTTTMNLRRQTKISKDNFPLSTVPLCSEKKKKSRSATSSSNSFAKCPPLSYKEYWGEFGHHGDLEIYWKSKKFFFFNFLLSSFFLFFFFFFFFFSFFNLFN